MIKLNVLVACEESQVVTTEFRKLGHNAFSCDLLPTSGEHPEWHFQCDARDLIYQSRWDLIIAHPPCTFFSRAGSWLMFPGGKLDICRFAAAMEAKELFLDFYYLKVPYCIENPVPMKVVSLPKPSQYVQPFWFGDPYSKRTLFWLNVLPPLFPTEILAYHCEVTSHSWSSKVRSKTFPGIAKAMAVQWSDFLLNV